MIYQSIPYGSEGKDKQIQESTREVPVDSCRYPCTGSTASKPKQPYRTVPTTSVPLKSPVPIKFSNDTERPQYINFIRKSTAGAQVKRVIGLLFEAFTPEQINEFCYVDINANKTVLDILRKNIKVNYDGRCFSYKSKHDVKSKQELLVLIRKTLNGVAVIDLKDTYPSVMEDLQELKAAGEVWLLSNLDSEDIVYPNDPRAVIKVNDDIKQLFRGIELPRDMGDRKITAEEWNETSNQHSQKKRSGTGTGRE